MGRCCLLLGCSGDKCEAEPVSLHSGKGPGGLCSAHGLQCGQSRAPIAEVQKVLGNPVKL